MTCPRALLIVVSLFLPVQSVPAASNPLAPDVYRVQLRYQINAYRTDRIVQYQEMMKELKALGFQPDPRDDSDIDDPTADRLTGSIAARDARKLLLERHVRALWLSPKDAKPPANLDALVRVQLDLSGRLPIQQQRLLVDQTRGVLEKLGYKEGVGYNSRGSTRLIGMMPLSKTESLLNDLRRFPAGEKVPAPFASRSPVLVIEVMPDVPLPKERPKATEPPPEQEKIAPTLRTLLANETEAAKPQRLEIILGFTPAPAGRNWQGDLLTAAPGLVIEGELGPLVTVAARPNQVLKLAALPIVSVVRLPQLAEPFLPLTAGAAEDNQALLAASSLDKLHGLGHRGRGIRVAVVDSDFRGWEALVGQKLPKTTRYVDFTAERNPTMQPDPFPGDNSLGYGTRCALAVLLAAPEAELTLVRVEPSAPYQLQSLARYINGDVVESYHLEVRHAELALAREGLDIRERELLEERRLVLSDFGQDKFTVERRQAYFKKQAEFEKDEKTYYQLVRRLTALRTGYRALHDVRLVASSLVWNEGHPVDGTSTLSRYFDDRPFRSALWFQAAGNTRGQAWTGLFRDADGNGVMEFAPPTDPPQPDDGWRKELNFLAWQPYHNKPTLSIPAGTRCRIAMQWREPHDPEFHRLGEDPYLKPLVNPRLVLVRQLDPTGARQPAFDLEVIAQSVGPALRLQNDGNAATYEQTLEFQVPADGRYALRIEGLLPRSIRPASEPTLPALERSWELRPRLFLQTLAGPGRFVFHDYATDAGTIGMPGDARRVLTVGAANRGSERQPYSAGGSPLGMELLLKPNLLAPDQLVLNGKEASEGTGTAASFAAGMAASIYSANLGPKPFLDILSGQERKMLRVPEPWLRK